MLEEYLFYGVTKFEAEGVNYDPFKRELIKGRKHRKLNDQAGLVMEYLITQKDKIVSYEDIQIFAEKRIGKRLKNLGVLVSEVLTEFEYVSGNEYMRRTSKYSDRLVIGNLKPTGVKFGQIKSGEPNSDNDENYHFQYDQKNGIIYDLMNDNSPIFLIENENIVMKMLIRRKKNPVTTDELKMAVYGTIIGVNVARYPERLRDHLGDTLQEQKYIKTVKSGDGYLLREYYDRLSHAS